MQTCRQQARWLSGVVAWCAVAAGSVGCAADLGLPGEATISCDDGTPCPEAWVCRPGLGRCVAVGGLDTEPPRLAGEADVFPPRGGRKARFEVGFVVSEPLGQDPELTVGDRSLSRLRREGLSYVYAYTPVGDEPEGPAPVSARLVDRAGNVAEGLSAGTLVFDFTPPSAVTGSVHVSPDPAGEDAVLRVRFAVDEPLGPPAEVRVGEAGVARPAEAAAEDGSLLFEYPVSGDEAEGWTPVLVRLEDEAGNVRADEELGGVRLDFTSPEVAERELPEEALRPGDVVAVLLSFTEPVAGEPAVSMSREDGTTVTLDRVVVSPAVHSYLHTVREAEHGVRTLTLSGLADAAGNVADPAELGRVRVDALPPGLAGGRVELLSDAFVAAEGEVRVAFEATEAVRDPVVMLELDGGDRVRLEPDAEVAGQEGTRFVHALSVVPGHPEGTGQVSVALEDLVGNRGGGRGCWRRCGRRLGAGCRVGQQVSSCATGRQAR